MATIVVDGSGICGTAAALMLAREGHEVTVVDRDAAPLPADVEVAWPSWGRRGIGQFRMAHLLLARGTAVLLHRDISCSGKRCVRTPDGRATGSRRNEEESSCTK